MTSQPGKQKIAMHILPNISKSKGNQTMKFAQLMEYNMRNIFFLKNHAQKNKNFERKKFLLLYYIN